MRVLSETPSLRVCSTVYLMGNPFADSSGEDDAILNLEMVERGIEFDVK